MDDLSAADVMLRQAIYFEYLKEYEADRESDRVKELFLALLFLIQASGVDFEATVTKVQIAALIKQISGPWADKIVAHNEAVTSDLYAMFKSSIEVSNKNYVAVAEPGFTKVLNPAEVVFDKAANKFKIVDKLYSGSTVSTNKLWREYVKGVTPGVGTEPLTMVKDLGRSMVNDATKLVKQAYVEKWTPKQIKDKIIGTKEKALKDGLINKTANQAKTTVRTIGSSIGNWVGNKISRLLYDKYQWVSTIDAVTTTICRQRHLNIYEYGKGPLPPAHHNCRSITIGVSGSVGNQTGPSYYSWLQSQPNSVIADVLTPDEAKAFKSKSTKASDYSAFRNDKRLSPEQFNGKVDKMQTAPDDATT